MTEQQDPKQTTIKDAAARIGKSPRTVWTYISEYDVETEQKAGLTLVNMADLREAARKMAERVVAQKQERPARRVD